MSSVEHPLVRRFVEDAGAATQALGLGRVLGQLYAYLYFSPVPRTLDDMTEALGISKGSASMAVRQLEQWDAVERVWVKGDRKDYYSANDYFGKIIRRAVLDTLGKRIESLAELLAEADVDLNGAKRRDGKNMDAFLRDRVQRLRKFQKKAQEVWNNPLVKMMVK